MKPVCVKCQRFFKPKKNGYYFIESMPKAGERPLPGTQEPEGWTPYKLWAGDLYECDGCGAQVISGVGRGPIAEHYESDFTQRVAAYAATLHVNDC